MQIRRAQMAKSVAAFRISSVHHIFPGFPSSNLLWEKRLVTPRKKLVAARKMMAQRKKPAELRWKKPAELRWKKMAELRWK